MSTEPTHADEPTTPTTEPEIPEPDAPEVEPEGANREAARYRRQLRDTETERDTLAAQLDTARRALIEHGIGNVPPAAFWALNADPAALLDDDGQVDAAKVAEAARAAFTSLGLPGTWRDPARKGALGPYVPSEGSQADRPLGGDGFTDAFRPSFEQA